MKKKTGCEASYRLVCNLSCILAGLDSVRVLGHQSVHLRLGYVIDVKLRVAWKCFQEALQHGKTHYAQADEADGVVGEGHAARCGNPVCRQRQDLIISRDELRLRARKLDATAQPSLPRGALVRRRGHFVGGKLGKPSGHDFGCGGMSPSLVPLQHHSRTIAF